jgi:multidrug efflux pump subunit AcrA (membrane-fusion protein)
VERGFISLNQVEVLSGLDEGERVVVEKLDRLRNGDRVRIKRDAP